MCFIVMVPFSISIRTININNNPPGHAEESPLPDVRTKVEVEGVKTSGPISDQLLGSGSVVVYEGLLSVQSNRCGMT